MKYSHHLIFLTFLVFVSCGKSGDHNHSNGKNEPEDDDPNEALYNQVDSKHMDVMAKMDDLYKYKVKLTEKIANTPTLAPADKQRMERIIAALDSADMSMKDWMHDWMNQPDTTSAEYMRSYFESEMQSILKLEEQFNEVIELAKGEVK